MVLRFDIDADGAALLLPMPSSLRVSSTPFLLSFVVAGVLFVAVLFARTSDLASIPSMIFTFALAGPIG